MRGKKKGRVLSCCSFYNGVNLMYRHYKDIRYSYHTGRRHFEAVTSVMTDNSYVSYILSGKVAIVVTQNSALPLSHSS